MYEYVLLQLAVWKGRWQEVADGSGVPLRTLEKIARKETEDPRYNSIQKLFDWFKTQPLSPPVELPRLPEPVPRT